MKNSTKETNSVPTIGWLGVSQGVCLPGLPASLVGGIKGGSCGASNCRHLERRRHSRTQSLDYRSNRIWTMDTGTAE
jgi:uncharacterized ferredoxin-like protein